MPVEAENNVDLVISIMLVTKAINHKQAHKQTNKITEEVS